MGESEHLENRSGYLSGKLILQKAFDSLNHKFRIAILKKCGLNGNFRDWIKILLTNQESCVVNGRHK